MPISLTISPAILQSIKIAPKNASSQPKIHQYPGFRPITTPTNKTTTRSTIESRTHLNPQLKPSRLNTLIQTILHPQTQNNTNTSNPYRSSQRMLTSTLRTTPTTSLTAHKHPTPRLPPTRRENIPQKHSKWKPRSVCGNHGGRCVDRRRMAGEYRKSVNYRGNDRGCSSPWNDSVEDRVNN
jgi:hypothetical protein